MQLEHYEGNLHPETVDNNAYSPHFFPWGVPAERTIK